MKSSTVLQLKQNIKDWKNKTKKKLGEGNFNIYFFFAKFLLHFSFWRSDCFYLEKEEVFQK